MGRGVIRTTCPYCGVGCGLRVAADGTISGDQDHPANAGRLCSKGAALGETLSTDGRLLYPQIGGRSVSWDEALDRIAAQFSQTIREHGPDAVALYVSGQFLTEDYYVANKLMKGFIGSANIDTNSRLCMASSVAGHVRAFGEDIVPGCYEDIELADLVVLVGSNTAWCHPVLYQRLAAAREVRGTKVVAIDPRRTPTCEAADIHLAIRPGSDVALFTGLLVYLVDHGACDEAWTRHFARDFAATADAARLSTPTLADAAAICDVAAADLARFYELFAATTRAVTVYSQGVNQSSAGTDKVNAIINCHLATGRLGKPGTGPLSLTGQPNAMGGREVGGLANQLAAHMNFAPGDIARLRRFWQSPHVAGKPGLKAVDLFDAALGGKVKALWILGTNPAASMPRAGRVRAALGACPFVAVSDCWPTDTTRLADVVLPAAAWGEKDGTVTNSERCISRQRAFRAAPGAARPDWWMLSEVAGRMGFATAFSYDKPAQIFREHAALSAFENEGQGRRIFDLGALATLSDEAYDAQPPVRWPLPHGSQAAAWSNAKRLFGDGREFTATDGRAHFVPTPYRPPAAATDTRWPFVLNTGRIRDQWHTMTRTGRVPRLMAHQSEPALDIHPADAARNGLNDGDLMRIESPHGAAVLPARLSGDLREGELFAPMHWTDQFTSAGPIDALVGAAVDPVSGQPELKATPVRIAALPPHWHGLLLRASDHVPHGPYYWGRVPLERGHAFTLTGWEPLPSDRGSKLWIAALLDAPAAAELVIYADPARGTFRYASVVGGRLDACLFIAGKKSALPARDALAALLGKRIEPQARTLVLAGAGASAAQHADGPTICTCFGVALASLHRAIAARRLTSVAEIGAHLRAGTNCGSCLPELRAILSRAQSESAARA
jgi:assimilatory nitrate reductase catalytic subunit